MNDQTDFAIGSRFLGGQQGYASTFSRRLGIRTVAVYSDADEGARHVAMADEAFRIGPPPARESYLQAGTIVEVARRSGARGDYDTPEQRVGKFQFDRPWETCMTICHQWSWKPDDRMISGLCRVS